MRSLKQYIHDVNIGKQFGFVYPLESSFDDFLSVNNFTEDTVTEDACNWYAERCWDKSKYIGGIFYTDAYCHSPLAHINEMLTSVDINMFMKTLSKELECGVYIDKDIKQDDKKLLEVKQLVVYSDKPDIDKIVKTCDKLMWTLSSVLIKGKWNDQFRSYKEATNDNVVILQNKKNKAKYYKICVEPIKSEIVTDYVKSKCNYKVYHICEKKNVDKILKAGLRPKGESNGYRFIKNKIFCFCGKNNKQLLNNIKEVSESLFNMRMSENKILYDDAALLEIDWKNYNIDFYHDTMYDNKDIIYTYAYFPPKMIKEITLDEITA